MTTLVLGDSVEKMFRLRVVPVLQARGAISSEAPLQYISRALSHELRLWTINVQRPAPGLVRSVRFEGRIAPRIFDCRVSVHGLAKEVQGEQMVCVRHVYGLTASCEVAEGKSGSEHPVETCCLLAITCKDLTLVMDILPGKDCWVAVAVWANETLPMDVLLQRPERLWSPSTAVVNPLALSSDDITFATKCAVCDGSGSLDCEKCEASGWLPCNKCGSQGDFECQSCGGSGVYKPRKTCSKCGGSGNFVGRNGKVVGSCNACGGRGVFEQLDCNRCSGAGRLTCRTCDGDGKIACYPCDATGSVGCSECRATGYLPVRFSTLDGLFTGSAQDDAGKRHYPVIAPRDVCAISHQQRDLVRLVPGAAKLLLKVTEATRGRRCCEPLLATQIENHCRQFQAIEGCLNRSLEANNIREAFPIHLGRPEASLRRSRNGVIYEFSVNRGSSKAWVREGKLPFPEGSPVLLCAENGEGTLMPVELPRQSAATLSGQPTTSVVACSGNRGTYRLAIRFPTHIDIAQLPSELVLKLDAPPPPEKTQLKHLRQWCGTDNRDHPILHALISSSSNGPLVRPPRLFNPGVAKFPRQVDAVSLALSSTPLGLIKGPPGTGKTTIITEIVRQLTARGQKVLICSQTHQAVLNVLERLHKEGGFRMIRHGHEDSLTDIEKTYLGGGAEDAYFHKVVSRTRDALHTERTHGNAIELTLKSLPDAVNAAIRLRDVRNDLTTATSEFTKQADRDTRTADEILSQQLAHSETTERTTLADIAIRRKNTEQELQEIKSQLSKADHERESTAARFRAKTNREPTVVAFEPSTVRWFRDTFVPDWLASADTIQERFSVAMQRLAELKPKEQALSLQLDAIADEDALTRRVRTEAAIRDREVHAKSRSAIERLRSEKCEQARDRARTEEEKLRLIQAGAVSCVSGLVNGMTDDSSPDLWSKALAQMTDAGRATSKRCEFISEWLKDIEAEPSDVNACYWDHLQVFFSTCVGVGSWRRLVERGRDAVDLVIIDEAAHATATETLIPLLYAKRAILIGDEMQLPPIMPSNIEECGESCSQLVRMAIPTSDEPTRGIAGEVRMTPCWLGCSYFEWIWRALPNVARTMLDTQFRMHPSIAEFVGSVFYPEGLVSGVSAKERELGFGEFSRPVCLISTSAYENRHEEFLDPGYRNELEARAVRRVIEKAEAELKHPQDFGVITPYAEQKHLINRTLADLLPDLKKVRLTQDDVASVDSFQGSERDVIIVSFARSPKPCGLCQGTGTRGQRRCDDCQGKGWRGTGLTFARDLRRLNVAFSRARKMLILIGDIEALTDARYRGGAPGGKVLNLFKQYVADQGKVLHLWERHHEYE